MDVDGRPYNTRGVRRNYAELAGLATRTTNAKVKVALQKLEQAPPDEKDDAMDALAAALKAAGLGMGGRRRTRKHKGKKRGGRDPCDDLKEQVKELEEGIARRDRQLGRRGGTRKHKKHSRKTRRGGVQPPMSIQEKVKMLRAKLAALEKTGNASPAEIAAAEKEWSDAYTQMKRQMGPLERGYRADHGFAG
jgi:hypothetical protein